MVRRTMAALRWPGTDAINRGTLMSAGMVSVIAVVPTVIADELIVPATTVETGLTDAGVPSDEVDALVETYASAQLGGLKAALLAAGLVSLGALWFTRPLPSRRLEDETTPAAAEV